MGGNRIGLALCGAELAGSTHIGILCALEELGIQPHVIAGTSAGAMIASMYAHGYSIDEFRKAVKKFPGLFLLDYGYPLMSSLLNLARHKWITKNIPVPRGIFRGEKLRRYIRRLHGNRLPKMPFYVVATDLYTTDAVAFTNDEDAVKQGYATRSTDLHKEIVGSCSIPGVFTPVRHRQWMLVDGAVRDLIPVSILRRAGCDKIFAVDVMHVSQNWSPITMVDVLKRSLLALMDEAADSSDTPGSDVFLINPQLIHTSWWATREPMMQNLDLGYKHVLQNKREILAFVGREE